MRSLIIRSFILLSLIFPALASAVTHTASGTFAWNATTGVSTTNWTSSDFTCDGPSIGTKTNTGVVITATTMTNPNDSMTWTRPSGTAGNGVGTWTFTDSTTGNSYTLTVNANGTVSLTGMIVQCGGGGGGGQNIQVEMRTDRSPNYNAGPRQHVNIDVSEPIGTVSSVSVSGPGITNSLQLTHGPTRVVAGVSSDTFFGGFDPSATIQSGSTYTFTVTNTAGSSSTFNQTYTGTAVTDTATGAISITSPTGHVLTDAALGSPLNVQWTLPAAYSISQVKLGGYVQTSMTPGQGYQCWVDGPTLAANAVSGSLTLPSVCGPNNAPALQAGINVSTDGTNGERSIIIYQFSDTTGGGGGGADTLTPSIPVGLSATPASSSQVNLTWAASTDNVGVTGYKVYRNGSLVGTPAGPTNNFWPDNSAVPNTTYSYAVAACDAANNCSAQSTPVSATTPATSTTTAIVASGLWNLKRLDPSCNYTDTGTFNVTYANGAYSATIYFSSHHTSPNCQDEGPDNCTKTGFFSSAQDLLTTSQVKTMSQAFVSSCGDNGSIQSVSFTSPDSVSSIETFPDGSGISTQSTRASSTPTSYALAIAKSGTGSGTVTSSDGSIDCGSTCSGSFASATPVTLTATPSSGSTFAGWSGDCSGTGSCVVTINAAKNVTAIFVPIGFTLSVNSSGASNVQIDSSPASYAGSTSYSMAGIASGTGITLTAPAKSGNTSFGRWSGCDSSSGLTCMVTMNAAKSVTASYAATPYTLSVTPGNGTVTSGDGSINCGSTCSASFTSGTRVTLTATPAKDYLFDGWNGCDTSTKTNDSTGTCTVSIDSLRTVQPLFHYAAAVNAVTQGTNADGTITAPVATVTTKISFNPPDVGKTIQVYITALVPARLFAPPAAKQRAAGSVHAMAAAASNAFMLVQLTPSGWQPVVNGQMIPYTTGVLGDQISSITILNNTDTANLGGTQICVGYGTSASEMAATGRMQRVATIPDPNAANTNTGSCNVTIPISDARVFAYAEANYSSFFPGAATSGQYQQYNYRYYPGSQNYLAVDTSSVISVFGPVSGNAITAVGPVESFRSVITDWEAAP